MVYHFNSLYALSINILRHGENATFCTCHFWWIFFNLNCWITIQIMVNLFPMRWVDNMRSTHCESFLRAISPKPWCEVILDSFTDAHTVQWRYNAVDFVTFSQNTPHRSTAKAIYSLSFVQVACDWYCGSVPVITYVISSKYFSVLQQHSTACAWLRLDYFNTTIN